MRTSIMSRITAIKGSTPQARGPRWRAAATRASCIALGMLSLDVAAAASTSSTATPRAATNATMKEDFELPAVPVSRTYRLGEVIETRGRRWKVEFGSVDLMNQGNRSHVAAHDGRQLLELSGATAGIVSTAPPTRPGQRYTLTVHYARNRRIGRAITRGTIEVLGAGGKALLRDDIEHDPLKLAFDAYQTYSGVFTADAARVVLRLSSSTNGNFGITVDGITLTPAR